MSDQTPESRLTKACEMWGWKPHDSQREWLLDDHPVKVAACGRRWGKTESAAVDIATWSLAYPGSIQMIVAPTCDQSRLISGTVERLLLTTDDIRSRVRSVRSPYPDIRVYDAEKLSVISRITARTADRDGRNLRGQSADRVIVDEAAFVRDEVIQEVIGPMLADRNGRLIMISTPFGKNHFYQAFVTGMEGGNRVKSFRYPSWTNPHISREYIENQRAQISDRQFRVEYEAEFVDDTNSVFPWADIRAAVMEMPQTTLGDPRFARLAGVDWARYSDYTAVVVLEAAGFALTTNEPRYRVIALDRFNRMDWRSQVRRVCDTLAAHGVSAVCADGTSVGDPVLEMLREALWTDRSLNIAVDGLVFTAQSKRQLVDNLAVRLAHRELAIPDDDRLTSELQFYEYELTESGNVRTGAKRGCHDDCVMALALALRAASEVCPGGFGSSGTARLTSGGW